MLLIRKNAAGEAVAFIRTLFLYIWKSQGNLERDSPVGRLGRAGRHQNFSQVKFRHAKKIATEKNRRLEPTILILSVRWKIGAAKSPQFAGYF